MSLAAGENNLVSVKICVKTGRHTDREMVAIVSLYEFRNAQLQSSELYSSPFPKNYKKMFAAIALIALRLWFLLI